MMALTSSAIGRLLTAAALVVALSALALAAPKHDVKPAKPAAAVALEQHAAVFSVDQDGVRRADRRLVLVARRFFFLRDRGGGLGRLDVMLGRGQGERA